MGGEWRVPGAANKSEVWWGGGGGAGFLIIACSTCPPTTFHVLLDKRGVERTCFSTTVGCGVGGGVDNSVFHAVLNNSEVWEESLETERRTPKKNCLDPLNVKTLSNPIQIQHEGRQKGDK